MIYKIIVDKQPMTNPSADKKEYEIDIAPLYFKHDVYDSLVITHDEDYVMRRLELQDYNVLVELDPPVKEPLTNINIELFEGENYIYLYDMAGNKIVAQYLVKNEFNELYVLESTMNSAITQSANAIELYVQQNYETLSHATSEYARIDLNAQGISTEVSKKVGKTEVISSINQSAEQVTINANKISLAGKTINMTSDDVVISSTKFNVDKNGNMSCTNASITGGLLAVTDDGLGDYEGKVRITGDTYNNGLYSDGIVIRKKNSPPDSTSSNSIFLHMYENDPRLKMTADNTTTLSVRKTGFDFLSDLGKGFYCDRNGNVYASGTITGGSLESQKKNFEKLQNATEIIKDTEIYKYNYKTENDDTKKHIGFVIGDNYKYSKEVTSNNNDGVDIYSFVAVCCKAIQEQQEEIQELKERIEKLEKGDK